ncbi:MAG: hybrid sensor histidine kinase/response regulator [Desulfobulbaceae bacterium]
MLIYKRRVGFRKFSTKVIVMTIVIYCIVLPLLIALLIYRETIFLTDNYYRRGQDMLAGVREASRIALLAEDAGRLQSIAGDAMKHRQEILYTVFYRSDWGQIYASAAGERFQGSLAHSGEELQQELAGHETEWVEGSVIRDRSFRADAPVTEFWSRISSSEIGELEMLADGSAAAGGPEAENVSGYICLGVSKEELTGTIGRITMDALIAGVLTLLTMSISTAWLLKRLMSPFSDLVNGVQAVAEGDMERTISVRSKDEVSSLADEFNKMVAALKEWQSKLLESESKFRSLFERIHSGILIFDQSGEILDSNPAMAAMVGYEDVESLTSVPMEHFFKNREECTMLLNRVRQERAIQDIQLTLTNRRTGKDVETNVSVTCQTDDKGDYEYSEAVFVDITHIAELEKRLLHAHKMEAVGTLAGGIAHDFNNILTVITGRVGLMGMDPMVKGNSRLNENLTSIEKSVARATNLVSQILGFARKGMYKEDVLHLNKVVADMRALLIETIDRRIELSLDLASELWPIKGDEGQIFQSLLNICLNGCDAMADGGRLMLATGNLVNAEDLPLVERVMPPGQYVFIKVEDTGIGMDAQTIEKIFDPFFTTKEVGKGTGLGMAMVHGIISNHRGYIHLVSRQGQGTVVTLYFPALVEEGLQTLSRPAAIQQEMELQDGADHSILLAEDPVASTTVSVQEPMAVASEGALDRKREETPRTREDRATVLLVDDEKTILRVNSLFFSELNDYLLVTAASGEEAVEIVKKDRAAIDFVVMDISMPGMGGDKAFRVIHELYPDLPVIIATGYAHDSVVNRMLEEGAVDLILKPYTGFDLVAVLNRYSSKKGGAP